jgi:glycerol-1-phosphate dehydrogenase [NAD(P)+]
MASRPPPRESPRVRRGDRVYLGQAFSYSCAVKRFFFQDFLSKFDSRGLLKCECGREHRIDTRTVFAEPGALEDSAAELSGEFGSAARIWVLSDENTEEAAGKRWKAAAGVSRVSARVLPARPKPAPTAELVALLAAEIQADPPDLLVSVGGGVISDVVKRISLLLDRPNWCVATAASVDAYSSATAAIDVNGFHNALPARVSRTIVCDPEVIAEAPRVMFLAGLGDLLAKFIAHLDWNLSRIMTGEYYCPVIASVAHESARSALAAARELRSDPREAVRTLTDAALSSGFAMQAMTASRSAASAEHTMAHLWETPLTGLSTPLDLHGILVGAASRMVLHAYRALYARLTEFEPDVAGRLSAFDAASSWQEGIEPGLLPYMAKVKEEMEGRVFDRGILSQRLETFRAGRTEILERARLALEELSAGVDTLESLGYPFAPSELGISRELLLLPFNNVRILRRRYSGFDLAWELGLENVLRGAGEQYAASAR